MKIVNICPKCSKESPPLEVGRNKEYKFCPYCGAPYMEEAKGPCRVSRMSSRIITTPTEGREMVEKAFGALGKPLGKGRE